MSILNTSSCLNVQPNIVEVKYYTPRQLKEQLRSNKLFPYPVAIMQSLDLSGFTELTILPRSLTVYGDLNLSDCVHIKHLPRVLIIYGSLYLNNCKNLTNLPEHVIIGANLDLSDCTSLASLPKWITELGYQSDGFSRHLIIIKGTSLSDTILDRLIREVPASVDLRIHRRRKGEEIQFPSWDVALQFWKETAQVREQTQEEDYHFSFTKQEQGNIKIFLERLANTAEYWNPNTRTHLASRIFHIFSIMKQDIALKEVALYEIELGVTTCVDRVISVVNDIEVKCEIYEVKKTGSEQELRYLALRLLRLDLVKQAAKNAVECLATSSILRSHIYTLEVEVNLLFQIHLKDYLDLPVRVSNMTFRTLVPVTDEEIDSIGRRIKDESMREQALEHYLQTWDPWKKHIRTSMVKRYSELPIVRRRKPFVCSIMLIETSQPILLREGNTICDYDVLARAYIDNGKNPFTMQDLDWRRVFRVQVKPRSRLQKLFFKRSHE